MQLFYSANITGKFHQLDEEESRHIARVLRLKTGDTISITDGKGNLYQATITGSDSKKCIVRINETLKDYNKRSCYIHIAIAPTKSIDRFEWFLEKATEIGIDEITPLVCEHSERKNVKTDRLRKIIIAAMKQSLKAYLPKLNEPVKFPDIISLPFTGQKLIAWYDENRSGELKEVYIPGFPALILIGPEGDFSPEEIETSLKNGYISVNLGKSRLRTETAGIVACHTLNLLYD